MDGALDVTRSMAPVQWYGGKGRMLAKLQHCVPRGGRPYVEPYCGGASLFFARQPAPVEVLNDLNGDLVNLFRVIQNAEQCAELERRITWTLYARAEFERALGILKSDETDPVTRAWALFVAQNQGFAGNADDIGAWGRSFTSSRGMAETTARWLLRQSLFATWHKRLSRVQIDCRDALDVIEYWDSDEAVFYVDPPYVHHTRKSCAMYSYEQDDDHHRALVERLLACRGAVTLSGYETPLYQPLVAAGWRVQRFETACHAAGRVRGSALKGLGAAVKHVPRVELVYINPRAARRLGLPEQVALC